MNKTTYEVRVYTDDDGDIHIDQPFPGHGDQQITLHADQINLLVMWLREARNEVEEAMREEQMLTIR